MNDTMLNLGGIKKIQLSLELPKDAPRANLTSFFILLARKNGISCSSSVKTVIKDDTSVLNIVIINTTEQYESYMGYTAVTEGLRDNLILIMLGTDDNLYDVTYLTKADFTISEPLSTTSIISKLNYAYSIKSIRNRNIEEQLLAEHLIKEKRYQDAYNLIQTIKGRGLSDAKSICLLSEIYEGMGKNDVAFEVLHKAVDEKSPNYHILKQMYGLLSRAQMWDHASSFVSKLLNHYQLEKEFLRVATGNAIKTHKYNDVQRIIDYILNQDQVYRNYLGNFTEVTFYILLKFLIVNNKTELTDYYLSKMMKLFIRSNTFVRIVETSISVNNKSSNLVSKQFENSPTHKVYYELTKVLTEYDTIRKEELVKKCKNLIDQEKIRVKSLFDIFFDALEYTDQDEVIKKYENLYNYHSGKE